MSRALQCFVAHRLIVCAAGLLAYACVSGAAAQTQPAQAATASEQPARLYEGYGAYHRKVSTQSPEAQKWFDQGLQLLYGFNHDEAIRSFKQAAAIDPDCAMAWWGVAYGNGLHINNMEMSAEQSHDGYEAAQEALKRSGKANAAEQALIGAVAKRYAMPAPEDRRPLDEAYAAAMGEAWKAHPNDPDIGALYAESLMDLQPWDYWTHDGKPKGRIQEIISALEAVMAKSPKHPGANHFYIHALEASESPARALPSADLLVNLVPGSGHLMHMPSHIFIRTGRYADAADTNERAIAVDEKYFAVAPPPRFYRIYFIHNLHFLAYSAMMEGRWEKALAAGRRIEASVPEDFLRDHVKIADGFTATTLHVMMRFGKWDEILKEPEHAEERLVSRAMRHYARIVALSALGRTDEAAKDLEQFDQVAAQVTDDWFVGNNPAKIVLAVARKVAEGEMLYRQGQREKAFLRLREAVKMEEDLIYDEPPGWMLPVRHALGALLMGDGRAAEAEPVYREDLRRHPNNGWSLLGREQALRALGRDEDADVYAARLAEAWRRADVKPTSSCYCQPASAK